jgi:hypothetical protein
VRSLVCLLLVLVSSPGGASSAFEEVDARLATATTSASADMAPRASILQPTYVLQFQVSDDDRPAEASISFVAGARVRSDRNVTVLVDAAPLPPDVILTSRRERTTLCLVAWMQEHQLRQRDGSVVAFTPAGCGSSCERRQGLTSSRSSFASAFLITHPFSPRAFPIATAAA